jgi:rhomboid-like protein
MIGTSSPPPYPLTPDSFLFPLGLWMFCPSVATSVGSAVFLQVFLTGAVGCDLFSLFWNRTADERRTSIGASGEHPFSLPSSHQNGLTKPTGALCSIMSFTACLAPTSTVLLYGIFPVPLWGCVVGIFLYDLYGSQKKGASTVSGGGVPYQHRPH